VTKVVTKSSDDVLDSIRIQIQTESAPLTYTNIYSPFPFDLGTASKAFCVCPVVTGAATLTKLLAVPEGATPGWELGAGGPPVEEPGVGPPAIAGSGAETGAWKVMDAYSLLVRVGELSINVENLIPQRQGEI
jgi:hypothetical protein